MLNRVILASIIQRLLGFKDLVYFHLIPMLQSVKNEGQNTAHSAGDKHISNQ